MPSYLMNCDFFSVQFPSALNQDFCAALSDILTRHPNPPHRDYDKNGDTMRLTKWGVIPPQTFHKGLLIRMRNNSPIRKASMNTDDLDYVKLLSDERICEIMCFTYFDDTKTLAVHRNRHAGSPYWIEDYVEDKFGVRPELQVIFDSGAWDRLDKMGVVKKIDVTLSIPQNIGAIDVSQESVKSMVGLATLYRGRRVSFEISAGRQKEGLRSEIKGLARQVLGIGGDIKVAKLSAKGTDYDEGTYTLDLLSGRIKGSELISCAGGQVTVEEIWTALNESYYKVRNEIRKQANL